MRILGIDPGLKTTGLCILNRDDEPVCHDLRVDGDHAWEEMGKLVVAWVADRQQTDTLGFDAIALEDFHFRAPKVTHGLVKHAASQGKLVGFVYAGLVALEATTILVSPTDSKRDQPTPSMAKKLGIPGKNTHQHDAFYAASWLKGSMRMGERSYRPHRCLDERKEVSKP